MNFMPFLKMLQKILIYVTRIVSELFGFSVKTYFVRFCTFLELFLINKDFSNVDKRLSFLIAEIRVGTIFIVYDKAYVDSTFLAWLTFYKRHIVLIVMYGISYTVVTRVLIKSFFF